MFVRSSSTSSQSGHSGHSSDASVYHHESSHGSIDRSMGNRIRSGSSSTAVSSSEEEEEEDSAGFSTLLTLPSSYFGISPTSQVGTAVAGGRTQATSTNDFSSSQQSTASSLATHCSGVANSQEQRLIMLAKHPNADEEHIQHALRRQQQQREAAAAQALRKSQQFRLQQERLEANINDNDEGKAATPTKGPTRPRVSFQPAYEHDDDPTDQEPESVARFSCMGPLYGSSSSASSSSPTPPSSRKGSFRQATTSPRTLILHKKTLEEKHVTDVAAGMTDSEDEEEDSSNSFTIWQQASGEGTSEAYRQHRLGRRSQRPSDNGPSVSPEHDDNQKQNSGTWFLFALWTKVFPTSSASVTPSGTVSISSDPFEDVRSTETAGGTDAKSSVSRASYTTDKTPRMSNLSPQNAMENDDGFGPNKGGGLSWRRLASTRRGIVILCLALVVVLAIMVTVLAAVINKSGNGEDNGAASSSSSEGGLDSGGQPQFPVAPTPTVSMPIMPVSTPHTSGKSSAPSEAPITFGGQQQNTWSPTNPPSLRPQTTTLAPTNAPVSTPMPSMNPTPFPTSAPTFRPTSSPTGSPSTASPSAAPTRMKFETWTWSRRGVAIGGTEEGERFGQAVALSQDGKVLAVGAPNASAENGLEQSGMVQIFEWDAMTEDWIPRGTLLGRNAGDQFGSSISLSADGSVLAVSEPTYRGNAGDRSGNVRVFVYAPFNGYTTLGLDMEGDDATDHLGIGLALSSNGRRLAMGAPYHDNSSGHNSGNGNSLGNNRLVSGQAKVFEWSQEDSAWIQLGSVPLAGSSHLDWYGWSVDLNGDGSLLCVGAPRNLEHGGYVGCYEESETGNPNAEWRPVGEPILNDVRPVRYDDNFGVTIRIGRDPTGSRHRVAIGSPGKNVDVLDSGFVVVYELDPQDGSAAQWRQLGNSLVADNPGANHAMGSSIDLQGDLLAVGTPGKDIGGQVHMYRFQSETNQWVRHPRVFQGVEGSNFGAAVRLTLDGDLAVGSTQVSGNAGTGTVDVYQSDQR